MLRARAIDLRDNCSCKIHDRDSLTGRQKKLHHERKTILATVIQFIHFSSKVSCWFMHLSDISPPPPHLMDVLSFSAELIYGKLRWLWGAPGCQLSLDHYVIVAAVVLVPVTQLVLPVLSLSLTCGSPNIQSWMAKCKKKQNEINLSGQAEPSSPHRHRTDNIVLMKSFHLET